MHILVYAIYLTQLDILFKLDFYVINDELMVVF